MCLCSRVLTHAGTGNQLLKWIGDVWHHVKEITWPIILVCSVHSVNSRINKATRERERERRLSAVYLQHAIGHIISCDSSKAELIRWYHLPKPSASLTRCVVPSAGSCRLVVHCGTSLLVGWRDIDSLGGQDHPSIRRSEARDLEGYVQRRGERTPVRVDSSAYVGSLSIFIIIYQSMWPIVLVEIYLLPYCCKRKMISPSNTTTTAWWC